MPETFFVNPAPEHTCEFGPFHNAPLTGTPVRSCLTPGCRIVSLDGDDDDMTDDQWEAQRIVQGAEHLLDIAATGDVDALEEAFRSHLIPDWPAHVDIDPDNIDYEALTERFKRT